jgi:AcrR family transcriptional regulator
LCGGKVLQISDDSHPVGTQDMLIDVAEEQFAKCGLAGASLREISRIAGCGNTGAVRYHFGDRDGLIAAIFKTRLAYVERQRAGLMDEAMASGVALDMHRYLELLFRPVERQGGRSGKRSYAAFLAGLFHFGEISIWGTYSGNLPSTAMILDGLRKLTPHISADRFDQRMVLVSVLVWSGLAALDRRELDECRDDEAEFQNMLAMAAAALAAR